MTNQEKYAQQMQDAGVCDARGAALCATVKELPDGSFGMVLLGVKGNDLLIYDAHHPAQRRDRLQHHQPDGRNSQGLHVPLYVRWIYLFVQELPPSSVP